MSRKPASPAILWLTILAAPVALGFETLLRSLLFPPDFEVMRAFLEPALTPLAWVLGGAAGLAALAGLALQRRLAERRLARLPEHASEPVRQRELLGVFLLTASVPQIPAVLSTFAFMFGASLWPVLVGIALCSVGVVGQAMRVRSLAA
jgi:membrane protein YqaA with SNARE-associated domain